MAQHRTENLLVCSSSVFRWDFAELFKYQPMKISGEIAGALNGGDHLCRSSGHQIQQHARTHGIHTAGIVHDEDSLAARGFRTDQVVIAWRMPVGELTAFGRQSRQRESEAP